jgi:hypothetical protein
VAGKGLKWQSRELLVACPFEGLVMHMSGTRTMFKENGLVMLQQNRLNALWQCRQEMQSQNLMLSDFI